MNNNTATPGKKEELALSFHDKSDFFGDINKKEVIENLIEKRINFTKLLNKNFKNVNQCTIKEKDEMLLGGPLFIGTDGGLSGLVGAALNKDFKSFLFFIQNPISLQHDAVNPLEASSFKQQLQDFYLGPNSVIARSNYLTNLCSVDKKDELSLINQIKSCTHLGITKIIVSIGKNLDDIPLEDAIQRIAHTINNVLEATTGVKIVLDHSVGQGNDVGHTFNQIHQIIELIKERNQDRIGIFLDTSHLFAAGYNINSKSNCQAVFNHFDQVIGFNRLCGIGLSNTYHNCGSKLDEHNEINDGKIKQEAFEFIFNDNRFIQIPLILGCSNYDRHAEIVRKLTCQFIDK